MKRKKILISITSQFGYHIPTYMYCKYMDKEKFEVHYVGYDWGKERKIIEDVEVHYIPMFSNRVKMYYNYIRTINKIIRKEKFNLLFLVVCKGYFFIRMSNLFRKSVMDVRTGDVYIEKKGFSLFNSKIRIASLFFRNITILSESLREELKLPKRKCRLVTLGAEQPDIPDKSFNQINLFYIGTIQKRNIHQTVEGVALFLRNNPDIHLTYNIVGYGFPETEKILVETIQSHNLSGIVKFHGRKYYPEILDIVKNSNIGVAYVPIIKGYDCQPTTKLFEYVLAGMPVIATKTTENSKEILPECGVLVQDNPNSFAKGLEEIQMNLNTYNSRQIKEKYYAFRWDTILSDNLSPYLYNLC